MRQAELGYLPIDRSRHFIASRHTRYPGVSGFLLALVTPLIYMVTIYMATIYVAAYAAVRSGTDPQTPPMQTTSAAPPQLVVDADGIVVGGIRTPAVDAPVATLSGLSQTGGTSFCFIFGSTVAFTNEQLTARYRNHGRFVHVGPRDPERRAGRVPAAGRCRATFGDRRTIRRSLTQTRKLCPTPQSGAQPLLVRANAFSVSRSCASHR